jgi:hypothetical protein
MGGYVVLCSGSSQGKERKIQMLAGQVPLSQRVGSFVRMIHKQLKCSPRAPEVNITNSVVETVGYQIIIID